MSRPQSSPTSSSSEAPAETPARHITVPDRLREKGAAATGKVHAGVTHAREIAADKAPAVKEAVKERRGLAIGLAAAAVALGCLLLWRLRGRRTNGGAAETS